MGWRVFSSGLESIVVLECSGVSESIELEEELESVELESVECRVGECVELESECRVEE